MKIAALTLLLIFLQVSNLTAQVNTPPVYEIQFDTAERWDLDIIKAHGGELKVQTKENEGSEFIINIPAKN